MTCRFKNALLQQALQKVNGEKEMHKDYIHCGEMYLLSTVKALSCNECRHLKKLLHLQKKHLHLSAAANPCRASAVYLSNGCSGPISALCHEYLPLTSATAEHLCVASAA